MDFQVPAERRTANYKPSIWTHDLLESLASNYDEEKYRKQAKKLKEEVLSLFVKEVETWAKLELIDNIAKLGLAVIFEEEIKRVLHNIEYSTAFPNKQEDLYFTALCFRLHRQHGLEAPQDWLIGSVDNSPKSTLELFEASHLAMEGETLLEDANNFATRNLESVCPELDDKLAKRVIGALKLPMNQTVEWYAVKEYINDFAKVGKVNSNLLNLAKLNFNMVQATHQKELKEISRWWRNLSVYESLGFSRNRIVESYLCAVGVAFEPQYGNLRKWLTKVIELVLIIDDVYDIYGSLQELELFTNAVDRWDLEGTQALPECLKVCLHTLYNTANEIATEIQKENGWKSISLHIQKAWLDYCNSLLVEARWFNKGYTPSLDEYLDNGWISSSSPLLSLHIVFSVVSKTTEEVMEFLKNNRDLVYNTSIIIRLCNDQGTSAAELERGDAPSSIRCYMKEANVTDVVARKHIKTRINETWKKINNHLINLSPTVRFIMNTARVAHFMYLNGDGFGVQHGEIRNMVLALFMEPLELD